MSVLLITEEDIKKDSPVGGNVDVAKLIPAIKQAQITVIKPFLGNDLYNKILNDFKNNTLVDIYLEIYEDYVKSMLIHMSTGFYLTYGAYSISNKGVFKGGDEFSEGLTRLEIDYMVKAQEKYYKSYKNNLYKFLNDNKDALPEWEGNKRKGVKVGNWYLGKEAQDVDDIFRTDTGYYERWGKINW